MNKKQLVYFGLAILAGIFFAFVYVIGFAGGDKWLAIEDNSAEAASSTSSDFPEYLEFEFPTPEDAEVLDVGDDHFIIVSSLSVDKATDYYHQEFATLGYSPVDKIEFKNEDARWFNFQNKVSGREIFVLIKAEAPQTSDLQQEKLTKISFSWIEWDESVWSIKTPEDAEFFMKGLDTWYTTDFTIPQVVSFYQKELGDLGFIETLSDLHDTHGEMHFTDSMDGSVIIRMEAPPASVFITIQSTFVQVLRQP